MKTFIRPLTVACALLASTATHATTFNFSYTFLDGTEVSGAFDGTANGNVVTGLTHIFLSINGNAVPESGSLSAFSYAGPTVPWMNNPVVSFNGLQSNFHFVNGDLNVGNFTAGLFVIPLNSSTADYAQVFYGTLYTADADPGANIPSRWHLEAVPAVPEPGTYAMLLAGLGLIGVAARRKRQAG